MSACDMFADVPLAKAYHMAQFRDTVEGNIQENRPQEVLGILNNF